MIGSPTRGLTNLTPTTHRMAMMIDAITTIHTRGALSLEGRALRLKCDPMVVEPFCSVNATGLARRLT